MALPSLNFKTVLHKLFSLMLLLKQIWGIISVFKTLSSLIPQNKGLSLLFINCAVILDENQQHQKKKKRSKRWRFVSDKLTATAWRVAPSMLSCSDASGFCQRLVIVSPQDDCIRCHMADYGGFQQSCMNLFCAGRYTISGWNLIRLFVRNELSFREYSSLRTSFTIEVETL